MKFWWKYSRNVSFSLLRFEIKKKKKKLDRTTLNFAKIPSEILKNVYYWIDFDQTRLLTSCYFSVMRINMDFKYPFSLLSIYNIIKPKIFFFFFYMSFDKTHVWLCALFLIQNHFFEVSGSLTFKHCLNFLPKSLMILISIGIVWEFKRKNKHPKSFY